MDIRHQLAKFLSKVSREMSNSKKQPTALSIPEEPKAKSKPRSKSNDPQNGVKSTEKTPYNDLSLSQALKQGKLSKTRIKIQSTQAPNKVKKTTTINPEIQPANPDQKQSSSKAKPQIQTLTQSRKQLRKSQSTPKSKETKLLEKKTSQKDTSKLTKSLRKSTPKNQLQIQIGRKTFKSKKFHSKRKKDVGTPRIAAETKLPLSAASSSLIQHLNGHISADRSKQQTQSGGVLGRRIRTSNIQIDSNKNKIVSFDANQGPQQSSASKFQKHKNSCQQKRDQQHLAIRSKRQSTRQLQNVQQGSRQVPGRFKNNFTVPNSPWMFASMNSRGQKLQRLPVTKQFEEFIEYGGQAVCTNHSMTLNIADSTQDLTHGCKKVFRPKYTHQIYNSDETLRGHQAPQIDIFFSPGTLTPYLKWSTGCGIKDKSAANCAGIAHKHKADDIERKLQEIFGESLVTDHKNFIEILQKERGSFRPLGRQVGQFQRQIVESVPLKSNTNTNSSISKSKEVKEGKKLGKQSVFKQQQRVHTITKTLKVFKCNVMNQYFLKYNPQMQALLKFFIESASNIPVEPEWFYFLVYYENCLVGFATCFEEYLKVPKAPVTISQVLILPPYQQFGIGSALLDIIYGHYLTIRKCQVMIVEDPAIDFQRMKDALDIKLILRHGFFKSIRGIGLEDPRVTLSAESFKNCGLDHHEIREIMRKLKLERENVQRCFELIQIACLSPYNPLVHEAYRKYVIRKFTETRDLLCPYFLFEDFADNSLFSTTHQHHNSLSIRQNQALLPETKCCLGNGQLECIVEHQNSLNNEGVNGSFGSEGVISAAVHNSGSNQLDTSNTVLLSPLNRHLESSQNNSYHHSRSVSKQTSNSGGVSGGSNAVAGKEGSGLSCQQRQSRFLVAPIFHEPHKNIQKMKYMLPETLQIKIRAIITQYGGLDQKK